MYYRIYYFLHKSNEFLSSCSSYSPNTITNRRYSSIGSSLNSYNKLDKNKTKSTLLLNKQLRLQLNELSKNFDVQTSKKSIMHMRTLHGTNLVFLKRCDGDLNNNKNNEETVIISSNINTKLSKYVRQRKRIIVMLVTLIAVFYICIFPLKIWTFILILIGSEPYFTKTIQLRQYWYINISCRILLYLNSSINPILYNWFSKKFRLNFRKFVFIPKFIMNKTSI